MNAATVWFQSADMQMQRLRDASAAFWSLQLSRDYGQVLFTFVPGLKLACGIIRLGGAPPPPIFKSKLILQLNTVITWPEIRVYTMWRQICIWLRNKLLWMNHRTEALALLMMRKH